MGMGLSDLRGMSLLAFGELVEAWNAAQDGSAVKQLSDAESDDLSRWLDQVDVEGNA